MEHEYQEDSDDGTIPEWLSGLFSLLEDPSAYEVSLPFMPFYVGSWLEDERTIGLGSSKGLYIDLLARSWRAGSGASVPDDPDLFRQSSAPDLEPNRLTNSDQRTSMDETWSWMWSKVRACFYVHRGRLYQKRLVLEWSAAVSKTLETRQKRAAAGSAGGKHPRNQQLTSETKQKQANGSKSKQTEANTKPGQANGSKHQAGASKRKLHKHQQEHQQEQEQQEGTKASEVLATPEKPWERIDSGNGVPPSGPPKGGERARGVRPINLPEGSQTALFEDDPEIAPKTARIEAVFDAFEWALRALRNLQGKEFCPAARRDRDLRSKISKALDSAPVESLESAVCGMVLDPFWRGERPDRYGNLTERLAIQYAIKDKNLQALATKFRFRLDGEGPDARLRRFLPALEESMRTVSAKKGAIGSSLQDQQEARESIDRQGLIYEYLGRCYRHDSVLDQAYDDLVAKLESMPLLELRSYIAANPPTPVTTKAS